MAKHICPKCLSPNIGLWLAHTGGRGSDFALTCHDCHTSVLVDNVDWNEVFARAEAAATTSAPVKLLSTKRTLPTIKIDKRAYLHMEDVGEDITGSYGCYQDDYQEGYLPEELIDNWPEGAERMRIIAGKQLTVRYIWPDDTYCEYALEPVEGVFIPIDEYKKLKGVLENGIKPVTARRTAGS